MEIGDEDWIIKASQLLAAQQPAQATASLKSSFFCFSISLISKRIPYSKNPRRHFTALLLNGRIECRTEDRTRLILPWIPRCPATLFVWSKRNSLGACTAFQIFVLCPRISMMKIKFIISKIIFVRCVCRKFVYRRPSAQSTRLNQTVQSNGPVRKHRTASDWIKSFIAQNIIAFKVQTGRWKQTSDCRAITLH